MKLFKYAQFMTYWALQDMLVKEPYEGELSTDSNTRFCFTRIRVKKGDIHLTITLTRDFICSDLTQYQIVNVVKSVNEGRLGTVSVTLKGDEAIEAVETL